ncbi:transcriptional regulator [Paraferrimonas haliotis]|uniref:Transcriptional regulator n=2 Tax=Paraferrimonas haliotis TaxID=2013866 RepID=A0AA37WXL3_9GAMM|nr:transcriptional regulator [Paraferrimonas haliotis]
MQQLDYRPNAIAQSLASNRTNSIGIMVSELDGPFFGLMMAAIEQELRKAGKHVIITTGHSDQTREKEGIDFLISRKCDAIIAHVEAVSDEYLIEINQGKTPVYLISRYVEAIADKCVSLDNKMGGYLATKNLIENNHRDIAYVSGPMFKADAVDRLTGHKRALAEFDIPFNEELFFVGDFKETGGQQALKHFLSTNRSFTAIVCSNDEMASGAMKYAREHSISIPQELSIIGYDNVIFANYLYPRLTTITNPVDKMGSMAARLVLQDCYQLPTLAVEHLFTPSLKVRDSVYPI